MTVRDRGRWVLRRTRQRRRADERHEDSLQRSLGTSAHRQRPPHSRTFAARGDPRRGLVCCAAAPAPRAASPPSAKPPPTREGVGDPSWLLGAGLAGLATAGWRAFPWARGILSRLAGLARVGVRDAPPLGELPSTGLPHLWNEPSSEQLPSAMAAACPTSTCGDPVRGTCASSRHGQPGADPVLPEGPAEDASAFRGL